MGGKKLGVGIGLQTGLAVAGIAHHMGKYIFIGVVPDLGPVLADAGGSQRGAVFCHNRSPDHILGCGILLCIVDICLEFFSLGSVQPYHIARHQQKQEYKHIGDDHQLRIPLSICTDLLLLRIQADFPDFDTAGVLFVFLLHLALPHLSGAYTAPVQWQTESACSERNFLRS